MKREFIKIGDEGERCRGELSLILEQVKSYQVENQELLEEVKNKTQEVDDYRKKYLEALERCEDQQCEISALRTQVNRYTEQQASLNLEYRNELLSKELNKLQHLPMEIRAKEIELDEIRSALKIRDNTIDALAKDLEQCLTHSESQTIEIENERVANRNLLTEISKLRQQIDEQVEVNKELIQQRLVTERQNIRIQELEESLDGERRTIRDYENQVQLLREESAKQILRIKERTETQRSALQAQVAGLEKELAHARAAVKGASRERDETRARMRAEVMRLEGKFNEAQLEIKNLRSNIDFLKHSYSSIIGTFDDDETSEVELTDKTQPDSSN